MKSYKVRKELFIEGSELWYRYYSAKDYIADNGYFIIQKDGEEIPVYIPMLVLLFENKGIPVEVLKSGEHQYIKGRDGFLPAYQEAFLQGKKDFEKMYNPLRNQDITAFLKLIRTKYYSEESGSWNSYRYSEPLVFGIEYIQKCGIVAGYLYLSEYWLAVYNNSGSKATDGTSPHPVDRLEDLFFDNSLIGPCIEILQNLEKPIIDSMNRYIGNQHEKMVLCVWYWELVINGIIRKVGEQKAIELLVKKFTDFDSDSKTLERVIKGNLSHKSKDALAFIQASIDRLKK